MLSAVCGAATWFGLSAAETPIPLIAALMFGALICATDPIAVIAMLGELGVSKRLGVLIEGESLLNDGTSIVLFTVLLFNRVLSGTAKAAAFWVAASIAPRIDSRVA